ncbi:MAG: alpha/beta hydrolase [Verrucomicrobiota bacterium]
MSRSKHSFGKSLRGLLTYEIFPRPISTKHPVAAYIQSILIFAAVFYLGLMIFAWLFANKMIFPAPPASYTDADPGVFKIPMAGGGTISALYLENPQATHTLLYSHGNGEDIGSNPTLQAGLRDLGFNLLIYDYPGYGTTGGEPSEQGCYAAINAAYAYLTQDKGIPPEQIVLFGRSLGGGPSIDLAARETVGGVILDGTFTSTFRVMTHCKIRPWDCFDTIAKIDRIDCPLLVIHGTQDRTVPFWHGKALYEKAKEPKSHLWVEGAGHNNLIETAGDDYGKVIAAFRDSLPHE